MLPAAQYENQFNPHFTTVSVEDAQAQANQELNAEFPVTDTKTPSLWLTPLQREKLLSMMLI